MDKFDPKLLKSPTPKTLLFIARAESEPIFFNNNGSRRSITADFNHDKLIPWKSNKYWVFVWEERIHDKRKEEKETIYRDHYMYRYYLVPIGKKIISKKSRHQYDFGLHRVKESLAEAGAMLFLTIVNEAIDGYYLIKD